MKTLIQYIFIMITINSFACDCDFHGGFLKTAYYSDYVLKVKVTKKLVMYSEYDSAYFDNGVLFEVKEIIKGILHSDTISIFHNPFISCGPNIEEFTIGSDWIVAINRDTMDNQLYFSDCLIDYLKLKNNIATGNITINTKCERENESIYYDTLVKMINNPSEKLLPAQDCSNKEYYLWVNEMPRPIIGKDSLDKIIYIELNLENKLFDKCQYAIFNIYINSFGEIVEISEKSECLNTKSNNVDYILETIEILKNQIKWIPGNHFGKNMNIHMFYKVDFDEIKRKNEG